jgi:hypothetical protein
VSTFNPGRDILSSFVLECMIWNICPIVPIRSHI